MKKITTSSKLEFHDYYNFIYVNVVTKRSFILVRLLVLVFIVLPTLLNMLVLRELDSFYTIMFIIGMLLLFPKPFFYFVTKIRYNRSKDYIKECKLEITTKKLNFQTDLSEGSMNWDIFIYYIEKPDVIYLYQRPDHAVILAKRNFSESQWLSLLELVREKVELKK